MANKRNNSFYIEFECHADNCNTTIIKKGQEFFGHTYKINCPFCHNVIYPKKMINYKHTPIKQVVEKEEGVTVTTNF